LSHGVDDFSLILSPKVRKRHSCTAQRRQVRTW